MISFAMAFFVHCHGAHGADDSLAVRVTVLEKALATTDSLLGQTILQSRIDAIRYSRSAGLVAEDHETWVEHNLSSLVALFAVLMTLLATRWQLREDRRKHKEELESQRESMRQQSQDSNATIQLQIQAGRDATEKQVSGAIEVARLEFRQNVLSTNRQAWINKLRELVSELMTRMRQMKISGQYDHKEFEPILRISFEINLMLNPSDSSDAELLADLNKLIVILLDSDAKVSEEFGRLQGTILARTGKVLKSEWERVKRGE